MLLAAAVNDVLSSWDRDKVGMYWPGVSDDLNWEDEDGLEPRSEENEDDIRCGLFTEDLYDRTPYDKGDWVFNGYRKVRPLLIIHPVNTWFGEIDLGPSEPVGLG